MEKPLAFCRIPADTMERLNGNGSKHVKTLVALFSPGMFNKLFHPPIQMVPWCHRFWPILQQILPLQKLLGQLELQQPCAEIQLLAPGMVTTAAESLRVKSVCFQIHCFYTTPPMCKALALEGPASCHGHLDDVWVCQCGIWGASTLSFPSFAP